jgi:hypothetical protein
MEGMYYPNSGHIETVKEWFNGHEIEVHKIKVDGKNYEACDEASKSWWTKNKKGGEWNPGLLNSPYDPRKTERVGILGEMAFGIMTGLPVNLAFKEFGNTTDFDVLKYTLDVKTAAKNYGAALVRCVDEYGRLMPLNNDIYSFAYLEFEDREAKEAIIAHVGYQTKSVLSSRPIVPARKGSHKNYEIPYHELKTMSMFMSVFQKYQCIS